MVAVLVVAALVAGIVVVSVKGMTTPARMADAMSRAVDADIRARELAQARGAAVEMVISTYPSEVLDSGRPDFEIGVVQSNGGGESPIHLNLGSGYKVEDVRFQGRQSSGDARAVVRYSSQGRSASYGMVIRAADGRRRFLFIVGLTGEVQEVADEATLEQILQIRTAVRDDAR